MSFALDVNILLYASDTVGPLHARARSFLDACLRGQETVVLGWPTLMSYLRIATHPAVFGRPLTPADAMANVEALLRLPHVQVVSETDGFWAIYRSLKADAPIAGNLVPDAHLAALLRQQGVTVLYTHDQNFRTFGFLDVRDPFV